MTRPSSPLAVDIELAGRCNLHCRHCMASTGQEASTMPASRAFSLLDELAGLGVRSVSLTGGEPTLHPDFPAIIRRASTLSLYVQVSTNAADLKPEAIRALAETRASINASLDGADAATHDSIRGSRGAFRRSCAGIRELARAGARVQVETVLMRSNAGQISRIARLAARLGARRYAVNDLRVMGRAAGGWLRLDDAEFARFIATLPGIAASAGIPIQPVRWTGKHPAGHRGDCSAAVIKCGVRASGVVVPCLLFPPEVGHLNLAEAWNSDFFASVAGAVLHPGRGCQTRNQPETAPSSLRCSGCGGGCRAAAYAWSGAVDGPDPSCRREGRVGA